MKEKAKMQTQDPAIPLRANVQSSSSVMWTTEKSHRSPDKHQWIPMWNINRQLKGTGAREQQRSPKYNVFI